MKIKTKFAQMIVDICEGKPYYSIVYLDPNDGEYHVGYSSFDIKNTIEWLHEEFEIVGDRYFNPIADLKEEVNMWCEEIEGIKHYCEQMRDENSKLHIQYEHLLKEKSDQDRLIVKLEGKIEAYQFCVKCRR